MDNPPSSSNPAYPPPSSPSYSPTSPAYAPSYPPPSFSASFSAYSPTSPAYYPTSPFYSTISPPASAPANPLFHLRESIINQSNASASLAKHLISTKAKDDNLVFSPLSLHVALGLIAAGSVDLTRDQILGYFKSNSGEELKTLLSQLVTHLLADGFSLGGPLLSTANGAWVDQSLAFKPEFKEIVQNDYRAACNNVDFQNKYDEARREVNAWVEKETNGLIKDLISSGSVDFRTKLIFANAVYF